MAIRFVYVAPNSAPSSSACILLIILRWQTETEKLKNKCINKCVNKYYRFAFQIRPAEGRHKQNINKVFVCIALALASERSRRNHWKSWVQCEKKIYQTIWKRTECEIILKFALHWIACKNISKFSPGMATLHTQYMTHFCVFCVCLRCVVCTLYLKGPRKVFNKIYCFNICHSVAYSVHTLFINIKLKLMSKHFSTWFFCVLCSLLCGVCTILISSAIAARQHGSRGKKKTKRKSRDHRCHKLKVNKLWQ